MSVLLWNIYCILEDTSLHTQSVSPCHSIFHEWYYKQKLCLETHMCPVTNTHLSLKLCVFICNWWVFLSQLTLFVFVELHFSTNLFIEILLNVHLVDHITSLCYCYIRICNKIIHFGSHCVFCFPSYKSVVKWNESQSKYLDHYEPLTKAQNNLLQD